jgi:hypothetical protein
MAGTSLPRVDGDVPLVKHIKPLAARARLFPCANSAANKTKRSRRDRAPVLVALAAITFITTYLVCWVALSVYGSRPENRPTNWLYFGRGRGPTRYQQGAHRPTDAQKQRGLVRFWDEEHLCCWWAQCMHNVISTIVELLNRSSQRNRGEMKAMSWRRTALSVRSSV